MVSGPEIQLFQFGDNNVNLFRGDVNTTLNLINLPSRNNLDVSLSLFYKSNIQDSIYKWNLEAPTGVVGLGWSFGYERIIRRSTSPSLENSQFFLASIDNEVPLLRSAEPWELFVMGLLYKADLKSGSISEKVRMQFAENSIYVSSRAEVIEEDGWWIYDRETERDYRIIEHSDGLIVEDGGIGYELNSYQFWKIQFYRNYEKWLIVKENGLTSIYGGGVSVTTKGKVTSGNQVQWKVKWANWLGNSSLLEGQEQYAVAWNLTSNQNIWGDKVSYAYEVVEQAVGSLEGLKYTKACYLSAITDVFGRKVKLNYAQKDLSREVMDPHKPFPDDIPNAYQDCYETRHLESINLWEIEDTSLILSLHFESELIDLGRTPQDVANYGNTAKRYLRTISQKNAQGETFPGVELLYYVDNNAPHPGALKSITSPQGSVTTYTYRQKDLPICSKSRSIQRPKEDRPDSWLPRIWFGPDYAVLVWYNADTTTLKFSIFSWLGFWHQWPDSSIDYDLNIDISTLDASIGINFCALWFKDRSSATLRGLLFHQNRSCLGQWVPYSIPISFSYNSKVPSISSGDDFIIILHNDQKKLYRYTWDWKRQDWQEEILLLDNIFQTTGTREYYASAIGNYYIILSFEPKSSGRHNILKIFYLDKLGEWHEGGNAEPNDISINGTSHSFFWVLGETFAIATYVTYIGANFSNYKIQVFHWDENYQFTPEVFKTPELRAESNVQFVPVITNNCFFGSGFYLFRYNGQEWQTRKLDFSASGNTKDFYWFAYGTDLALVTDNGPYTVKSVLSVYDPNIDTQAWESTSLEFKNPTPPANWRRYFPTAGIDYISLDKSIYFRRATNDWAASMQQPIYIIPEDQLVNTTTFYNQAPNFLAYLEFKDLGGKIIPKCSNVLTFENGSVKTVESFPENMVQIYDYSGYPTANLNGKIPCGYTNIATFLPLYEDWNKAQLITIRRCLDGGLSGFVTDYSVQSIHINSGFETTHTLYEYDESTAVCDPTGRVTKYYRVLVYPGCQDKEDSQDGYTETIFYNGLPHQVSGVLYATVSDLSNAQEYYSDLDGFIETKNIYNNESILISSQKSDWVVKTEKLSASGTVVPIRGSYALLTKLTSSVQEVESATLNTYDLFSGQIIKKEATNYNSRGQLENWHYFTTFAYEKYPLLRALNILSIAVQTKTQVDENGSVATTGSVATRLKKWERLLEEDQTTPLSIYTIYDMYQWLGGQNPDFSNWDTSIQPTKDWQLASKITSITNNGLARDVQDTLGHGSSVLYSKDFKYQVASFSNAIIEADEADYLGFEAYENGNGWKMAPSGESWENFTSFQTAHTGERSLCLAPKGNQSLKKTFKPLTKSEKYLFTCWYKTEDGFSQNGEEAGWKISFYSASSLLTSLFIPFEDSQGDWHYLTRAIDLTPYITLEDLKITFECFNHTSSILYLDNLRFSPYMSDFIANVFGKHGIQTASLGSNNQTVRFIYNTFHQCIATVGPCENVTSIGMQYLSLQENATFSTTDPNSIIAVSGMKPGFYSDFRRDGGYEKHWVTAEPAQWVIEGDALLHKGTTFSVMKLASPVLAENYAICVYVHPQSLTSPLGIKIGENNFIEWNPATRQWQLKLEQEIFFSEIQKAMQNEWLVFLRDNVLLFFANGKKIFAVSVSKKITGTPSFFVADAVAFSRIVFSEDVQLALSYLDGTGKTRQSQALSQGNSLINAIIYDYLGRGAVTTKVALLPPTSSCHLLSYRSNFVESLDWDTGIMTGDVSTYYSSEGPGSNDQGYPYARTRYDHSPLNRVVETGAPGKEFAIVNLSTMIPEERHTIKYSYFVNRSEDGFMDWLPRGKYFITQVVDADGNVSKTLSDQSGNLIGKGNLIEKSSNTYQMVTYQSFYSNTGKKLITFLPNYYNPPEEAYRDKWKSSAEFNMLGHTLKAEAVNIGCVESVYNTATGISRFVQDAQGRADGYFKYYKYDPILRLTETGIYEGIWDRDQLQEYANNDPSWPVDCPTWYQRAFYDGAGDGMDPNLIGRLTSQQTHGDLGSPNISNEEHFNYNIGGAVTNYTLKLLLKDKEFSTSYTYNNQGKAVSVKYPSATYEAAPLNMRYYYNELGQIQLIREESALNQDIARYCYNADGNLQQEELAFATPVTRKFQYNSPGWLTEISDPYYSQINYYTRDSQGNPGYYTGLVVEEQYGFLGETPDGVIKSYSYHYTYNSLDYMVAAINIQGSVINRDWSIGLDQTPTTYDMNGNVQLLKLGEDIKNYSYENGKDELKNTTGSDERSYSYNLIGSITASKSKTINNIIYNPATGKEQLIQTSADNVHFEYNGMGQRLIKENSSTCKTYIHGLSANPLLEFLQQVDGTEAQTYHLYGANGRIGFIRDGVPHLILCDSRCSTRTILGGEDGAVLGAYNYLPFGEFMGDPGGMRELFSYFYTSQELDEDLDLYNYKARFYDPSIGRFYGVDVAGEFASPYLYARNNSIMYVDPSGNWSTKSIVGLSLGIGVTLVSIAAIGLTAGAATPAAVVGMGFAVTAMGGAVSTISYSATHQDNWNTKGWAIEAGIGAAAGLASYGAGAGGTLSAICLTKGISSFTTRAIAIGAAGIVSGTVVDSGVNVLSTLAYNGATGTPLSTGLGLAAGVGAATGFIGGTVGAVAGIRMGVYAKYRVNADDAADFLTIPSPTGRRAINDPGSYARLGLIVPEPGQPRPGRVGIWDTARGSMRLGDVLPNATPLGQSHCLYAEQLGYESTMTRTFGSDQRKTFPDLRGFGLLKLGDNEAGLTFNSLTLNEMHYGQLLSTDDEIRASIHDPIHRLGIILGLRDAGIRTTYLRSGHGVPANNIEGLLMRFMRTP